MGYNVTSITVTFGRVVNTGNYSSMRLEYSATVQVLEDKNVVEVYDDTVKRLHGLVQKKIDEVLKWEG